MNFSAWVYVQQQTLGTLRHIALSKHIPTYHTELYVEINYKLVNVKPNKYVYILINTLPLTY